MQELEDLQVLALDDHVVGGVPVDRLLGHGDEGADGRLLDDPHALGLARPDQPESLRAGVDPVAEGPAEGVEVDPVLPEDLREGVSQRVNPVVGRVDGSEVEAFGVFAAHVGLSTVGVRLR